MDELALYRRMAVARAFELALADLWRQGRISGELHLGTGEEAVAAGLTAHMRPGDGVALDHRGTPVLVGLGVDREALLRELVGDPDGICGGRGGHMHLLCREHLAASSGIVGASGPLACGFGIALKRQRPGAVAVALFGDGALNQGQLLESFNLAKAWALPVVFVCKDNGWAITTASVDMTGGTVAERGAGFGLPVEQADGLDVAAVHEAAGRAIGRARSGGGPSLLWARCSRLDGHFVGDAVISLAHHPVGERSTLAQTMSGALTRGGGGLGARVRSMVRMTTLLAGVRGDTRDSARDPLVRFRKAMHRHRDVLQRIDDQAISEVSDLVARTVGDA